jgi:ubiquitin
MATMYFKTETGEPFTANAVTGDDGVAKGHCVKVTDAPDNIAEWRMKYNFSTSAVEVYATADKTDDEAVQAQLDANATEKSAEVDREKARIAANAG